MEMNDFNNYDRELSHYPIARELKIQRDTAIAERDALAKALEECREDSIELLGERCWYKDERYKKTQNNIARADAALAQIKTNN